jgi:hypothetical protein
LIHGKSSTMLVRMKRSDIFTVALDMTLKS